MSNNRFMFCAEIINESVGIKKVNLLDVGAGSKELKNYLKKNIKYESIDYPLVDFETDRLPFSSKRFDVVACFEVLEHLKNPNLLLKEIKRILKNDSLIFISMPNSYFLLNRLRFLFGKQIDMPFEINFERKHLHLPKPDSIKSFVGKHFKIEKYFYFTQPASFNIPMWIPKIYPNLLTNILILKCRKKVFMR